MKKHKWWQPARQSQRLEEDRLSALQSKFAASARNARRQTGEATGPVFIACCLAAGIGVLRGVTDDKPSPSIENMARIQATIDAQRQQAMVMQAIDFDQLRLEIDAMQMLKGPMALAPPIKEQACMPEDAPDEVLDSPPKDGFDR